MNREGNLDLTSLRIFIETAKDCNMTRAAAALGISQPAVSAAIKKIENSLGSPVFDRDRRPIQLTTAGRLLWNRSFLILEQLDDLTRSIHVNFQRFPTLDAKKLVNAPKMSAHHRGICHF